MTKTYDDILSTADLENLDSFLKAWDNVITILMTAASVVPGFNLEGDVAKAVPARQKECSALRRKLAVAIHYSQGGERP